MKKLIASIIVLSALTLLCSIGWGCGDIKAQKLDSYGITELKSYVVKCPALILDVNTTSMEINHCFYMPDIDGWVVNRASDSADVFIQRDSVYFFHIHK